MVAVFAVVKLTAAARISLPLPDRIGHHWHYTDQLLAASKDDLISRVLLTNAAVILLAMIAVQLMRLTGTGTFHADSYYIPLREFVDADQHEAMEQLIVAKYNAASSTSAKLWLLGLVPVLICVVFARRWIPLQTTESQDRG